MKIKVTANKFGLGYLTVGKTYEAKPVPENAFEMIDDEGDYLFCLYEGSAHGYEYEVVDETV